MPTLKEQSQKNWNTSDNSVGILNAGSLQRIADATELMAKNFLALQSEVETYKRQKEYWMTLAEDRGKTISAMRGVITKLKKKVK